MKRACGQARKQAKRPAVRVCRVEGMCNDSWPLYSQVGQAVVRAIWMANVGDGHAKDIVGHAL